MRAAFRTVLETGRRQGEISNEADMEFLADMVSGVFIAVMLHWLNEPGYPLRRRMSETASFLESAFRAPAAAGGVN